MISHLCAAQSGYDIAVVGWISGIVTFDLDNVRVDGRINLVGPNQLARSDERRYLGWPRAGFPQNVKRIAKESRLV